MACTLSSLDTALLNSVIICCTTVNALTMLSIDNLSTIQAGTNWPGVCTFLWSTVAGAYLRAWLCWFWSALLCRASAKDTSCVMYWEAKALPVIVTGSLGFPHLKSQSRISKLLYDRRSVSQSKCLGIEHTCGNYDKLLLPARILLSAICGLVSAGRPLWREDVSAICSVTTQWPESRSSCNHTSLSHLRLPQTWRDRFPYLYPPETGWPSYTPGHWVPFSWGI
jgi:hypothetical protein